MPKIFISYRREDSQSASDRLYDKLVGQQLTELFIGDNPNLTKAEIDKLQQALPECKISLELWT